MSATTLAFALLHPASAAFDEAVTVYNPGGMVKTSVHFADHRYWIELIGNATFTHQLEIAEDLLHQGRVTAHDAQGTATGEQEAYQNFIHQLPHFNLSVN